MEYARTDAEETALSAKPEDVRRALRLAALLNAALVIGLGIAGLVAESSGLIANALDNASDTAVYAVSYAAVRRGAAWKTRAAQISGSMLLVLCVGVLADVGRRFTVGAEPVGAVMVAMTVVAALVNVGCLRVLRRVRNQDVSLRAAWTFSINDLVSNLGLLMAGILVAWLGRSWPDLVIAVVIALIAAKGGVEILSDARRTKRSTTAAKDHDRGAAAGESAVGLEFSAKKPVDDAGCDSRQCPPTG